MATDVAEDPDINLNIPLRPVFEELCCPICFSVITQCMITPCGHNFCEACILECLNRKHQCPCCNNACVRDQLIRNRHFDKLIVIVNEQKEVSSKLYFEKLVRKPTPAAATLTLSGTIINDNNSDSSSSTQSEFSPIESLFQKHMKRSLMAYEDYYQQLKSKHERSCVRVRDESTRLLTEQTEKYERRLRKLRQDKKSSSSSSSSSSKPKKTAAELEKSHTHKVERIRTRCDRSLAELEKSFNDSITLLLDAYDKYMNDFAPTPAYLPVTISLTIPSKNIRFDRVQLSTTDSLTDIKQLLTRLLTDMGNPIQGFHSDNIFSIKRPLETYQSELDELIILDENRPLVQYKIEQGSEIALRGDIKLESDKPKMCFTARFQKGEKCDYFTCEDCKFKWICRVCAENCHQGHRITPYLQNHEPSWACCYCMKHRKCKIINSRNMDKATGSTSSSSSS